MPQPNMSSLAKRRASVWLTWAAVGVLLTLAVAFHPTG